MSNPGGGSKADTVFKLVLIFFISLLSFSVGTYVGKQVSDSNYRQAALELQFNGNSQVADANNTASNPATKPINDQQTKSLAQEFINAAREPASANAQASSQTADQTTAQNGSTNHLSGYTKRTHFNSSESNLQNSRNIASISPNSEANAADRVANNLSPAKARKLLKRHVSMQLPPVATTAIGKYTVQIASYANQRQARARAAKLKKQGYSAFYVPAVVRGRKWFRVSIGLFASQKGAMDYRTELLATKAVSAAIVQKIVR